MLTSCTPPVSSTWKLFSHFPAPYRARLALCAGRMCQPEHLPAANTASAQTFFLGILVFPRISQIFSRDLACITESTNY